MGEVLKFEKPPAQAKKGCSTCLHKRIDPNLPRHASWWACGAQGGWRAQEAWDACLGQYWEPLPPKVPVLVRFKRWLIG